jgi:hypothetical protein
MPSSTSDRDRTVLECVARLSDMRASLDYMRPRLPDDMRLLGEEAQRTVHLWLDRLGRGDADLAGLAKDMARLAQQMDALSERLALSPWSSVRREPV